MSNADADTAPSVDHQLVETLILTDIDTDADASADTDTTQLALKYSWFITKVQLHSWGSINFIIVIITLLIVIIAKTYPTILKRKHSVLRLIMNGRDKLTAMKLF